MSYYYNYYVGYKSGGKIYPLGPYNSFGQHCAAVCRSRNFASNLHDWFRPIKREEISDELRKEFEWEDWNGNKKVDVKVCKMPDLPKGSFIKTGYFLIDDVKRYEQDEDYDSSELFYDHITPNVYAALADHERQFGRHPVEYDKYGEEIPYYNASDYMYYAYPDYSAKEYEADIIREIAGELWSYSNIPDDAEMYALETEG